MTFLALLLSASWALGAGPLWPPTQGTGILLLDDGGGAERSQALLEVQKALSSRYPVELVLGGAAPRTLQRGIDRLEARKAGRLLVVPLSVPARPEALGQLEYLLGARPAPPRAFLDAPRAHRAGPAPRRARLKAALALAPALDGQPLVADILLDRAKALSRAPSKESLILLAESLPGTREERAARLGRLAELAEVLRSRGSFASAAAAVLGGPGGERELEERRLRALATELGRKGRVLLLPYALALGGIERPARRVLDGLFCEWAGPLLPDARVARWVEEQARVAAGRPDARRFKDGWKPAPPGAAGAGEAAR